MTQRSGPQTGFRTDIRHRWGQISHQPPSAVHLAVIAAALIVPPFVGRHDIRASDVWVAVTLCSLSVLYAVVVRSSEQTRRALHDGFGTNLQTMWVLAGAAVLPPMLIPVVGVFAFGSEWSYQRRSATAKLERKLVTFAVAVLSAVGAAAILEQTGMWLGLAVVGAELLDLVLIFVVASMAAPNPTWQGLKKRFKATFECRSLVVHSVGVGLAVGLSYLLLISGSGGALGYLTVPGFVILQAVAAKVSAKAEDIVDPLTGVLTYDAWVALAGEREISWPTSVLSIIPGIDDDMSRMAAVVGDAVESFDPGLDSRRAILIGRVEDAICVVGGMNPGYAHPVVKRLEADLARANLTAVVEETVAQSSNDLRSAVDEAVRAGRRRVARVAESRRAPGSV